MRKKINKARGSINNLKGNVIQFMCKKQEGNEQLIVALVMIAISVALVLIFKDKISTLLAGFMTDVTTKINGALGV